MFDITAIFDFIYRLLFPANPSKQMLCNFFATSVYFVYNIAIGTKPGHAKTQQNSFH